MDYLLKKSTKELTNLLTLLSWDVLRIKGGESSNCHLTVFHLKSLRQN